MEEEILPKVLLKVLFWGTCPRNSLVAALVLFFFSFNIPHLELPQRKKKTGFFLFYMAFSKSDFSKLDVGRVEALLWNLQVELVLGIF